MYKFYIGGSNMTNTKINFRTKFKKLLKDEDYSIVEEAFKKFCTYEPAIALKVLWNLTYSSNTAVEEVYKLGLDNKIIPEQNFLNFRNELRYQYEQCTEYNEFDLSEELIDDENITKAFLDLKNKSDVIVAVIVYEQCKEILDDSELERTLYLLQSDRDNNYFGGIRSMRFNIEEADYLKTFHMEIYNLLNALNNFIPFFTEIEEESEEIVDVQNEVKEPEEVQSVEPYQIEYEYTALTSREILSHKKSFETLVKENDLNILVVIGQLGFDLNEVMNKIDKIKKFIDAIDEFES